MAQERGWHRPRWSPGLSPGWGAGNDPVNASPCPALLLSPCRGATAEGITPTPGQGPADVAWQHPHPPPSCRAFKALSELSALRTKGTGSARDKLEQHFHAREG